MSGFNPVELGSPLPCNLALLNCCAHILCVKMKRANWETHPCLGTASSKDTNVKTISQTLKNQRKHILLFSSFEKITGRPQTTVLVLYLYLKETDSATKLSCLTLRLLITSAHKYQLVKS